MNLVYPSKDFLRSAKQVIATGQSFNISIGDGWRRRVLAKEVSDWAASQYVLQMEGINYKPPSQISAWSMMSLITIYFMAISADYELQSIVNSRSIVLRFEYVEHASGFRK